MDLKNERVAIAGAGGFIGGHLTRALLDQGIEVVSATDIKPLHEWYQVSEGKSLKNLSLDLKNLDNCHTSLEDATVCFDLAADMGGMGFIENNKALCMLSVLTGTHLLMAAKDAG